MMDHSYELRSLGPATRGPDALDSLSQENNDKLNEEEGDWLKKLTDFAG